MTFRRLLGLEIAIIIYGLCAVGWADMKPINPSVDCKKIIKPLDNLDLEIFLNNYKTNGDLVGGRYVMCFDQTEISRKIPIVFQNSSIDSIVIYGLSLNATVNDTHPASNWISKTALSISGSNVLLQNLQLTGPGSNIAGSTGLSLVGSNLSVITSTVTGFETGIRADCAAPASTSPSPQPSPEGEGGANCTIGPQNVMEDVQQGVVLPTTSQGVTITQNEIRTWNDPYGTMRKILLQGAANAGLTPPAFSTDLATPTIWKTLSADGKFATEIGGVLPKTGTIELFEHKPETQADLTQKNKDYFRASCPTTQNDKGQWEFNCTGLNISAKDGIIFMDVTYTPNTSAMTKLIDVAIIPNKKITPMDTTSTEGGALILPASGSGTTGDFSLPSVAQNDMGDGNDANIPDTIGEAEVESGSAMSGGAMVISGDAAPPATSPGAGCGGQMMPEIPAAPGVMLWWLVPTMGLMFKRKRI